MGRAPQAHLRRGRPSLRQVWRASQGHCLHQPSGHRNFDPAQPRAPPRATPHRVRPRAAPDRAPLPVAPTPQALPLVASSPGRADEGHTCICMLPAHGSHAPRPADPPVSGPRPPSLQPCQSGLMPTQRRNVRVLSKLEMSGSGRPGCSHLLAIPRFLSSSRLSRRVRALVSRSRSRFCCCLRM